MTPRIIAHRGAKHSRPENTFAAFDEALVENANGMELDVQLTRDGVPVVYHDSYLGKLGLRHKRMADVTHAELRKLDAGLWFDKAYRGEPVPTLRQVLKRYSGRTELCIEIKPDGNAKRDAELTQKTLDLIAAGSAEERVYVLSFSAEVLSAAHRRAPDLRYVLNAETPAAALRAVVGRSWLYAVDVDIRRLSAEDGARLRSGGRVLMSYTCDTPAHLKAAQAAGVRFVITNRPAWALRKVKES